MTLASKSQKPVIFIFASNEGIQRCKDYGHWSADGTFSIAPKKFAQLYLINALIDKSTVPCLFALLQRKNQQIYTHTIILDFEKAAANAFHSTWKETQPRLCLFHLSQSLMRRVKKEHLINLYTSNDDVKNTVRKLVSLAFLPVPLVSRGYNLVRGANDNKQLIPVLNYFKRSYVMKDIVKGRHTTPTFLPDKWNHHDSIIKDLSRSNNAIENYNGKLNRHFQSKHPKLSRLIKVLMAEDSLATEKMAEFEAHRSQGISLTGRKNIHKANDRDIRAQVEYFDLLYNAADLTLPSDEVILNHLNSLQRLLNRNRFDDLLKLDVDDEWEDDEDEVDIDLLTQPNDEEDDDAIN
uniref:MULE transposase domain-containing protein n=1 Tax=Panagrolaimus superbus TaxID=310955 RepID=A0A914Y7Y9_9BILA